MWRYNPKTLNWAQLTNYVGVNNGSCTAVGEENPSNIFLKIIIMNI